MSEVTQRQVAEYLKNHQGMHCNCDLDNWQPEPSTGHSCVCRIHRAAVNASAELKGLALAARERT